jgi:hypothetical protein
LHGLLVVHPGFGQCQNRTRCDLRLPTGAVSSSHSSNQQSCLEHLYNVLLIGTVDGNVEIDTIVPFGGSGHASAFNDYGVSFLKLLQTRRV